jgi:hypothetical protein
MSRKNEFINFHRNVGYKEERYRNFVPALLYILINTRRGSQSPLFPRVYPHANKPFNLYSRHGPIYFEQLIKLLPVPGLSYILGFRDRTESD